MRDYFSIGFEAEAAFGRSKASQAVLPTPENKRDIPCDDCKFADRCAADITECSAFRNWAASGDFKDSDIGRFIRAAK
jgi:hypothetical protein